MSVSRAPAFTRLDPDGRRRQIIEAADRVFSEKPYSSVTMNEIAREARVTRGLLHHYFGGKTGLYGALLASLADSSLRVDLIDPAVALEELVATHVEAWIDFIAEHRELALTIGAGMHPEDPGLEEIVEAAREAIVDWITGILATRIELPSEARFLIRSYLGLTGAAASEWLYHGRATRQQVHEIFTRSLLAVIGGWLPPATL